MSLLSVLDNNAFFQTRMPGCSYSGVDTPLTEAEQVLRDSLYRDVYMLSEQIGERNMWEYDALLESAMYIRQRFQECGYVPYEQKYAIGGRKLENIEIVLQGSESKSLVIGAHYDSVLGCKGANDNATGVAALLALAGRLRTLKPGMTIRFVAFVNEEPPFSYASSMGSVVYAKQCRRAGEDIAGMFSLETIGYYTEAQGSQSYPFPLGAFYPDKGNFIGFVSNPRSASLLKGAIASFRKYARVPSEGAVMPEFVPGVGWSDQWAFWQEGYPAVMITDTALFRYPYYHTAEDTIDKIAFVPFTRAVEGLIRMVQEIAG